MKRVILTCALICLSSNALALIPVIDIPAIANLVKQYKQMQMEFSLLKETYDNAKHQLTTAKKLVRNSEGHYGFGSYLNNEAAQIKRAWSPATWEEALKGLSGGNAKRYQELLSQYQKRYPFLSKEVYVKGASEAKADVYQRQINSNRAAKVNARYTFDSIREHLVRVNRLSQKIELAPNMKSATDLNSRLIAELAYIHIQELKMQSLINLQLAEKTSSRIGEKTRSAKFNIFPK